MNALRSFHERIKLEPEKGSFTSEPEAARYSNKDLDPVPTERKKWEWYHVGGFWIAEGFNVAQLETPSSAVALGLNPGLTIVACLVGNLLVTLPTMSSGYLGSKYGLNFPVISRSSFGMKGAYVAMVIRAVVCVIWYGVQSSVGGDAVRCMLEAIWPSFKSWHINSLPESAFITAPELLSFFLFWLISIPFLFLSIPALRWMFIIKCAIMPFFGVALFTWALTAAHGWGPLFRIPNNIQGGWSVGYAFCLTITASISGNATFAINMSDITRYAHDRKRAWQMQAMLPVMITLTELLGTVMAASAQVIYGQVLWNPLDVVALWDNRAGKFFAGFCFAFANIATNVAGNSIPFANDLTGMFPKYINIRRGQLICAVLGWAICPWLLQAKAQRFFAFLNGYTVFLGPLIGILLSDYWLVRRRSGGLNVYQLYRPGGLYWFTGGVNPRALAALLIGMAPLLPGLIHNINPEISVSRGIQAFYTLSWLDGLVLSGLSYYLMYLAFPFPTNLREADASLSGDSPTGSEAPEETHVDIEKSVKPQGNYI
ncbi:NCS1 nucleoside transporter [Rhizodiscina lignyota]|uniref:NCS1 nucleoside transporter n=1 Tax=Rhizodiscina lignyota TaxID=1504668 RepID=A0A9P4M7V9_9PEZI|nr:NCS1 nucleoside transporter [Rhizodiscina lignyota]